MLDTLSGELGAQIFGEWLIAALEAWEIGIVAFLFVGLIVVVSYLLERWGVGLHA